MWWKYAVELCHITTARVKNAPRMSRSSLSLENRNRRDFMAERGAEMCGASKKDCIICAVGWKVGGFRFCIGDERFGNNLLSHYPSERRR